MLSLEKITNVFQEFLGGNLSPRLAIGAQFLIVGIIVLTLFAILGLVLVFMERKVSAFMQIRVGPNRVGYRGTAQTLADTVKLLVKEGLTPDGADKFLFNLAPFIVMAGAMLLMAPIAFAKNFQIWDLNIGVLYVTAVSSISVIGILMAGWSSKLQSRSRWSIKGTITERRTPSCTMLRSRKTASNSSLIQPISSFNKSGSTK